MCGWLCAVLCLGSGGAQAARVPDLYSAEVSVERTGSGGLTGAFNQALREVLIKVTGRRDVIDDPVITGRFSPADTYVQQYRTDADGTTWVQFDRVALRRVLDEIGQPVWGDERPVTLVWLIMDYGTGSRDILAAASDIGVAPDRFEAPAAAGITDRLAAARDRLRQTAAERGLPLVLPLVDSQELDIVSISDVWGGFTESVVLASQRYGADAILVGRARARVPGSVTVRWTLLLDDERFDWDGDIAGGPDRLADFLAGRLATSSRSAGQLRLRVDGVDSLDAYGRLSKYLATLDVVQDFSVDRVADRSVFLSLLVRGDADRLMRSIALRRVLRPIDSRLSDAVSLSSGGGNRAPPPGLRYELLAGP